MANITIGQVKVSVPSRGAIFLNAKKEDEHAIRKKVSVPSRGAIFLNDGEKLIDHCGEKFPSPLGELYFLMENPTTEHRLVLRFRPLSGSYIS